MENEKIEKEAEKIATELYAVFKDFFTNLVRNGDVKIIVNDIVKKTLVCKANHERSELNK